MAQRSDGHNAPIVVVANRLPVDRADSDTRSNEWHPSPGGLVAALHPVVSSRRGAWVGWPGLAGERIEPFDRDGVHLVPVALSAGEVAEYYEGFSNATIWPLYHDLTAPPVFERRWWDTYVAVNRRFAEAAAGVAADGAVVWVQDYQLQLVPEMLRARRPDLRIGFFNHIPFPGYEIYSRLPWRRQVVEGLLGADLVGFQRRDDAANFLRAVRATTASRTRGPVIIPARADNGGEETRAARAGSFPISIDSAAVEARAREEEVVRRAGEIREELGDPKVVLLGVDRLDYTKGIRHRLQAYGELLDDEALSVPDAVLVQVASPSRERVDEYRRLRDEVELTVGRINGDHSTVGRTPIHYLHQTMPAEEMAALYLAADAMLVTPLRDGMNLVAKEYVASRHTDTGALVLSEFTGAADELREALLVNPWDIDALKNAILRAATLPLPEARRRMRAMRRTIMRADVHHWAESFLTALGEPVTADNG